MSHQSTGAVIIVLTGECSEAWSFAYSKKVGIRYHQLESNAIKHLMNLYES